MGWKNSPEGPMIGQRNHHSSRAPLMRRIAIPLLALLALCPVLTGCTINPATGQSSFTGLMSESQEAKMGMESDPKVREEFGGTYDNAALQAYIQHLGKSVAAHSERPDIDYRFTVLNSDIVNAFAMPGGYIYITRGLLALANNEAEVAGVLGHETGHVVARHMAQRYSQSVLAQIAAAGLGMATGSQALGQLASQGAAVYLQSFSREEEYEADLLGVRYITKAGYDPRAMATFLQKLLLHSRLAAEIAGHPGQADQFDIMATHPRTADRVERAMAEAKSEVTPQGGAPAGAPILNADAYLAKIDGLLFGDDPKEGVVRGQKFLHPVLRFTFQVPEGYRLMNGADQVTAQGADEASAIAFDLAPKAGGSDPMAYLTQQWAAKFTLSDTQPLTINGLSAATGRALVDTDSGRLYVRMTVIRMDTTFYRFLCLAAPGKASQYDSGFQSAAASFRRLSAAEAAAIKPKRLRIVTVSKSDTVASLAQRMAFTDYREERFRALNGLQPNDTVSPGQRVKIVVE
jgi:predicted Zn-dependent protease